MADKLLLVDGTSYLDLAVADGSDLLLAVSAAVTVEVSQTSMDYLIARDQMQWKLEREKMNYTVDKQ